MFCCFRKNAVIKFSDKLSQFFSLCYSCHSQNKNIKAETMNKMKKKTNNRVSYIHGNKIQLLIKEKIRNFKNLLFRYFWEQLLRVKGILINYHVCIIVCLEMPFGKSSYHIGTSHQICIAIQFTVFYMIRVFTEKYFATAYSCSCHIKILETKQCRLFPKFVTSIMEL